MEDHSAIRFLQDLGLSAFETLSCDCFCLDFTEAAVLGREGQVEVSKARASGFVALRVGDVVGCCKDQHPGTRSVLCCLTYYTVTYHSIVPYSVV